MHDHGSLPSREHGLKRTQTLPDRFVAMALERNSVPLQRISFAINSLPLSSTCNRLFPILSESSPHIHITNFYP